MLIKKADGRGRITVTFILESLDDLPQVYLVGDFNDWNSTANPMYHAQSGMWWLSLDLESGQSYQYRYRTMDGAWIDDQAADGFDSNDFGVANGVVNTLG